MLAVCVPIYNFDVRSLVKALENQLDSLKLPVVLILIDDASDQSFKLLNEEVVKKHTYIENTKNLGRSKIRNLFVTQTNQEYLLFLDCDAKIIADDFLKKYLAALKEKPSVVCGGRIYPEYPGRNQKLSWKYGVKRESKPVNERSRHPNDSFMTNNFVIKRTLLAQHPFEEKITSYGHEDTLLGIQLKKAGIGIQHIDNPILNGDIETNVVFLEKTAQAVKNLVKIVSFSEDKEELYASITLLKTYKKTHYFHWVLRPFLYLMFPLIKTILKNGYANLFVFDLFKLSCLFKFIKKNNVLL